MIASALTRNPRPYGPAWTAARRRTVAVGLLRRRSGRSAVEPADAGDRAAWKAAAAATAVTAIATAPDRAAAGGERRPGRGRGRPSIPPAWTPLHAAPSTGTAIDGGGGPRDRRATEPLCLPNVADAGDRARRDREGGAAARAGSWKCRGPSDQPGRVGHRVERPERQDVTSGASGRRMRSSPSSPADRGRWRRGTSGSAARRGQPSVTANRGTIGRPPRACVCSRDRPCDRDEQQQVTGSVVTNATNPAHVPTRSGWRMDRRPLPSRAHVRGSGRHNAAAGGTVASAMAGCRAGCPGRWAHPEAVRPRRSGRWASASRRASRWRWAWRVRARAVPGPARRRTRQGSWPPPSARGCRPGPPSSPGVRAGSAVATGGPSPRRSRRCRYAAGPDGSTPSPRAPTPTRRRRRCGSSPIPRRWRTTSTRRPSPCQYPQYRG
jgi:hypothetical protein